MDFTMKNWYKKQAATHFAKYQKALDVGDSKKAEFHMKEFLTYDKASK